MVRAKTGVPGPPSAVLSYLRLFSSDGVPLAKRLGRGARLQELRTASQVEAQGEFGSQLVSTDAGRDKLSQSR